MSKNQQLINKTAKIGSLTSHGANEEELLREWYRYSEISAIIAFKDSNFITFTENNTATKSTKHLEINYKKSRSHHDR